MTISVVVPCFNEEESIPLFYKEMERVRIRDRRKRLVYFYKWWLFQMVHISSSKLHVTDSNVHYLSFFLEFRERGCIYAGLEAASSGEYVTVMDAEFDRTLRLLVKWSRLLEEQPDLDCVGTKTRNPWWGTTDSFFLCTDVYKLINHISQVGNSWWCAWFSFDAVVPWSMLLWSYRSTIVFKKGFCLGRIWNRISRI